MNTMPPRFVPPSSPLRKTAVRFFSCLVLAAAEGGEMTTLQFAGGR